MRSKTRRCTQKRAITGFEKILIRNLAELLLVTTNLLHYFVMRFEKLYGIEHTTFKTHSLTHLAVKVLNFGPLHRHAVFHFEGIFVKFFS